MRRHRQFRSASFPISPSPRTSDGCRRTGRRAATGFVEHDEAEVDETRCGPGCRRGSQPRSTTLKNRPRAPRRMQTHAMEMAAWLVPVPVPPISTTSRCCSMKPPPARPRTSVLFTAAASSRSRRCPSKGSSGIVIWNFSLRSLSSCIRRIGSGGGEAKTLPIAAASAKPLPTKVRACHDPPPTTGGFTPF